jgi:hypothetical protein
LVNRVLSHAFTSYALSVAIRVKIQVIHWLPVTRAPYHCRSTFIGFSSSRHVRHPNKLCKCHCQPTPLNTGTECLLRSRFLLTVTLSVLGHRPDARHPEQRTPSRSQLQIVSDFSLIDIYFLPTELLCAVTTLTSCGKKECHVP